MPLGLAAILSGVLPFLGQELGQAAAKETVKRGFDQATGKNKDRDKPVQFQMVDAQGLPVGYNQGGSFGPPTTLLPNQPVQQPQPPQGQGLGGIMAPQQQQGPSRGTQMRRGLGDALLALGAIGQGQDPFRAVATVRQQRFQQERAGIEDQQRLEDQQIEQQQRAEDRRTRAEEIAGKYAYEDKVRGEENRREDIFRTQDLQREDEQRRADMNFKLQQLGIQMQADMAERAQEQANVDREFGLKSEANARANQEAAAKEQERQNNKVLMGMYAEWLGLTPLGSTEAIAATTPQPEGQLAPASGPRKSPLDALPPEQKQLIGAMLMSGDTNGAMKAASSALSDQQKPLTEVQGNASMFYHRGSQANTALEGMNFQPGLMDATTAQMPGGLGNYLISNEYQQFQVHANDFVRAALRKESGATITPEEDRMSKELWIPQPGDSPETLAAKAEARRNELEGMAVAAGPGLQRLPQQQQQTAPAQTRIPTPADVDNMSDEEVNQWLQKLRQ